MPTEKGNIYPVRLVWDDNIPYSPLYSDIYFSREGGTEETNYVFLNNNQLPERFKTCRQFTIGETGFGTGLNFLVSAHAFLKHAPGTAKLHYISAEQHPLYKEDLVKIHQYWPEFTLLTEELQTAYPMPIPGIHRLWLADGSIKLTLLYGDAATMFEQCQSLQVDAWYLDGFAPKQNPQMWTNDLFKTLASFSHDETTIATFTAAGFVKRGLEQAGFHMQKANGYAKKREMLYGTYRKANDTNRVTLSTDAKNYSVIVIGGGLAGASVAHGLALRGQHVTVIEKHKAPAHGASGNPCAILYPFLSHSWMTHTRFYLEGMQTTREMIRILKDRRKKISYDWCGMLMGCKPHQTEAQLRKIPKTLNLDESVLRWVEADEASHLAGFPIQHPMLHLPYSGWINLAELTHALLDHPLIKTIIGYNARAIEHHQTSWNIYDEDGKHMTCHTIILANGHDALTLLKPYMDHKPNTIETVRGQITYLPVSSDTQPISKILCYGGYMTPAIRDRHHLGATYEHEDLGCDIRDSSHAYNIKKLEDFTKCAMPCPPQLDGWAAIRTTTQDKLPCIGSLPLPNLYVSIGHGSRGALSCPLGGEILASLICNTLPPCEQEILTTLSPKRFILNTSDAI